MKIKNRNGTEGIIPVFIMMKSVRMDIILAERKSFSAKMLLKKSTRCSCKYAIFVVE